MQVVRRWRGSRPSRRRGRCSRSGPVLSRVHLLLRAVMCFRQPGRPRRRILKELKVPALLHSLAAILAKGIAESHGFREDGSGAKNRQLRRRRFVVDGATETRLGATYDSRNTLLWQSRPEWNHYCESASRCGSAIVARIRAHAGACALVDGVPGTAGVYCSPKTRRVVNGYYWDP